MKKTPTECAVLPECPLFPEDLVAYAKARLEKGASPTLIRQQLRALQASNPSPLAATRALSFVDGWEAA